MPTYRRPLNSQQREILQHLARFRFGTASLFSHLQNTHRYSHERLRILLEQAYIGKHYDSSYKLAGRPAAYYLLPKGIDLIARTNTYNPKLLQRLGKDSNASDRFIRHCVNIFAASLQLNTIYTTNLQFRTRSDYADNKLFPQPLPDGYAFLENPTTKERTHYFIECFDGTMPESVMRATITKHTAWYDNDNWTSATRYPTVLLICRDKQLKTKVDSWVQNTLAGAWSDDVQFELLLPTL